MTRLDPPSITTWHAHVYFDASSRDAAWALREAIASQFGAIVQLGRFHEKPVGPHPLWSYQLEFDRASFGAVIEWLTLNRGQLDVFAHPNTGDALVDHRDRAVWIGRSYELNLKAVGG
ncbi:DOPA 4,5-dioxygenase family protein [Trinickia dinghuensis]|uniref:4,5-dioxygenase n=1 Tax=Trinickia dinghuensis TaxID=2291023 RepID=A0A3D8JYB4_9BURK|nr:DOPA 4,5-dioxygenase family protein [Trinickia dinghuensis]RDU97615.1 4,5-dioxygenase [Trinickia dinghuensis]